MGTSSTKKKTLVREFLFIGDTVARTNIYILEYTQSQIKSERIFNFRLKKL